MRDANGGLPGLAERLNHLFATIPRPDRTGYWTNEQASAAMAARGKPMSDGYISELRSGKKNNPSARNLGALAELFGVPVDYFFNEDTAAKIDADLRLLVALRDGGVPGVAMRTHGLSPDFLENLAGIIEHVRKLESLPQREESEGDAGGTPPPSP